MTRTLLMLWTALLLTACAKDIPRYVQPHERPVAAQEQPWPAGQFLAIAWHDVEDGNPDQTFVSVSSGQLVEQFNWLHENGYQPVSVDQILAAGSDTNPGGNPLPAKAVLLTFDDGYASFYTRVLPLLRAWNWPAVLAPVGAWMDAAADETIDFGGMPVPRERFLNWAQVTEIAASGLVEIAAHTDRSHYGVIANPQGNTQPAAAVRAWLPEKEGTPGRYETDAEFRARLSADVAAISAKIRRATGKNPRVWVWPYGEASGEILTIVAAHGYQMALTLQPGLANVQRLMSAPRTMPINAAGLRIFAQDALETEDAALMRPVHIRLDDVYDADPAVAEQNVGTLVQRVYDLAPSAVFIEALGGDGASRAYFPNRHLPVSADLFNRVAWQLRNRAGAKIWAVLPMQAAGLTREQLLETYEDLVRHAIVDGVWFKGNASDDFITGLTQTLRAIRGPQLQTARSLPADAQNLDKPNLDALYAAHNWLIAVAAQLAPFAARPGVLDKTVFMLPAHGVPASTLAAQMQSLQQRGVRHFGYGPDGFRHNEPALADLIPAFSTNWYPFAEGRDE